MSEFTEVLQLIFLFLVVGGAIAGSTWLLWVAGVQAYAFTRERVAQARIAEANADRAGADVALVRPDHNGLMPIHRTAIERSTDAVLALMIQRIDALRLPQPVPTTIHYAPQYAPHLRNNLEGTAQLEGPPLATVIPSFAQLLANGSLGNGRFLLGCDLETGQSITGDWKELYSTALGGLSGTGKSTTARFLLAQAALNGCKFVVLDPHAGAGEDSLAATLAPLRVSMLCEPASNDRQILDAAQLVADMGRKRIEGDSDRTPVIVCIDETTALLSRSTVGERLSKLIETIAQEYRKVSIFCLCSAQIWIAARSGGTSALRDSFASAYVHRMKRNQARLLLPTAEAQQVETLSAGQAVLWRTSGESCPVIIPNTVSADVEAVAKRIASSHNPTLIPEVEVVPNLVHEVVQNGVQGGIDATRLNHHLNHAANHPRAARVAQMLADGATFNEIIKEVWGVDGKGGNYQTAMAELRQLVAEAMQR